MMTMMIFACCDNDTAWVFIIIMANSSVYRSGPLLSGTVTLALNWTVVDDGQGGTVDWSSGGQGDGQGRAIGQESNNTLTTWQVIRSGGSAAAQE